MPSSPNRQLSLTLLLAFLITHTLALAILPTPNLHDRQTTTTPSLPVSCLEYSSIANLSTIGLNATLRAAYIQAAPDGTDHSVTILNGAEAKLPPLKVDVALNEQCGNLTSVALVEAGNNFTRGIVAQYRVSGAGVRGRERAGSVLAGCLVVVGMVLML
ncbi:hypothetical protein DL546_001850 [Coniochaeta pulveracea]|uniref:Uncharacterized protein n=1 Tax=Coniochaeta pulveracea TaxID=177199 RepID=A0A420YGB7_9PEZI|nr:hypothetical protein DL546_001850 [Coniochaeta pulveracea]